MLSLIRVNSISIRLLSLAIPVLVMTTAAKATEPHRIRLWEGPAPGENSQSEGTPLPRRANEDPPVIRLSEITAPTITVYPAAEPNGISVLILPGGGFRYVVTNKEGSEFAEYLNRRGVTAFVLNYRTSNQRDNTSWIKPLADAHRAIHVIRERAEEFRIAPDRLGVAGFSAGGQVAARLVASNERSGAGAVAFAMLIYPWNLYDSTSDALIGDLVITKDCPPVFLVHTTDDSSSSLGSTLFYAELRRHSVPAELHVFASGGHGYGMRALPETHVHQWPELSAFWLRTLTVE